MLDFLSSPLAHLKMVFTFEDGSRYDIEDFNIGFAQEVDHKGQPQHEVRGGQITLSFSQLLKENICQWMKEDYKKCSGSIAFETELSNTVLLIEFSNAYCVDYTQVIDAFSGTVTNIVISPEIVVMNGIDHNNFWPK